MKKVKAHIALALMAACISCSLCSCGSKSPMTSNQIDASEIYRDSDDKEQQEAAERFAEDTISDGETTESGKATPMDEDNLILSIEEAANYDVDGAVTVQESKMGLSMQVPERLCEDLSCNTDEKLLFEFYDQMTRDTTNYEGRVWSIIYLTAQDFQDRDEEVPTSWPENRIDANGFYIGKDDSVMYILVLSSDVQYDASSVQSRESYYLHYLYGYHMLIDFFERNDIEENPYWKHEYLVQLQRLGLKTGDFLTTEYGLGSTVGADERLLEKAAQIANLAVFDSDDALSWRDLLLYRLIHSDYSSISEESNIETMRLNIYRKILRFDESMVGNFDTERLDEKLCEILSRLFLKLKDDPSLPDLCMQEQWILTAEDSGYTLRIKNEDGEIVYLQSI